MNREEQFTEIFQSHYETVWRYSARRVGSDLAFDVVGETFLVAWRRCGEVPSREAEVLPWLLGVARKVVANEQRRQRRGDRLLAKLGHLLGASAPAYGITSGAQTAVSDTATAMQSLSGRDQEALQLVGWDGLSISEAARVVGCSPTAMANRVHRARRRLQAAVTKARGGGEPSAGQGVARGREGVAYESQ
ncbi:RNA polymerase sigma factor [Actinomadura rupiterrae]|uniref:RNA polymerase sigma factor n=1 Tax=Actinomadura rupiterrae TaxID=559627 RepID=UPI0020A5CF1B|nr:sigma-70 family RNA polymerase sigma factor [Actinomadura rupiterrae]MCP2339263.1 RNA polymerase sigma-70 factor (ECF subfamily) [Actinomadura rupiterrae]